MYMYYDGMKTEVCMRPISVTDKACDIIPLHVGY